MRRSPAEAKASLFKSCQDVRGPVDTQIYAADADEQRQQDGNEEHIHLQRWLGLCARHQRTQREIGHRRKCRVAARSCASPH